MADAEILRQRVVSELVVERRDAQQDMDRIKAARDRSALSLAVARSELDEVADALVDGSAGDQEQLPTVPVPVGGRSHREEVAGLIEQLEVGLETADGGAPSTSTETTVGSGKSEASREASEAGSADTGAGPVDADAGADSTGAGGDDAAVETVLGNGGSSRTRSPKRSGSSRKSSAGGKSGKRSGRPAKKAEGKGAASATRSEAGTVGDASGDGAAAANKGDEALVNGAAGDADIDVVDDVGGLRV